MISTLDFSQRVTVNKNPALEPGSDSEIYSTRTYLNYNFSSETRTQLFDLRVGSALKFSTTDASSDIRMGSVDPRIYLSYSQYSSSSRLDVTANFVRGSIGNINPLLDAADPLDPDRLAPDFAKLTGSGRRDAVGLGATLAIWNDARFGMSFSANLSHLDYHDATHPALQDTTQGSYLIGTRYDISEVLTATADLHYTSLGVNTTDGSRTGIDLGFTLSQPDGSYSGQARFVNGEDGLQTGLLFARTLERPTEIYTLSLGAARATTGEVFPTGYVSVQHEAPDMDISLTAERRLNISTDDTEEMLTTLSLGAATQLSEYGRLGMDVDYGDSLGLVNDNRATLSSVKVSYYHALSEDWTASARVLYNTRKATGEERADNTSFALTLSRSFDLRH
jgi:hypothetical protein